MRKPNKYLIGGGAGVRAGSVGGIGACRVLKGWGGGGRGGSVIGACRVLGRGNGVISACCSRGKCKNVKEAENCKEYAVLLLAQYSYRYIYIYNLLRGILDIFKNIYFVLFAQYSCTYIKEIDCSCLSRYFFSSSYNNYIQVTEEDSWCF